MKNRVTIITPTYNRAHTLAETIQSVLNQGYEPLEYIVLDDGSTDATAEILESYQDRIQIVRHENMGETRTVNKGFQMAAGEYLCVVNSDDILLPGAIHRAVQVLDENPEVLVAFPDWTYIDENSCPTHTVKVLEHNYRYMVSQHKCYVGAAAFFRSKALEWTGGRDPAFKYVADFDFWLRLGLHGPFKRIPETLGTLRVHRESTSVKLRGKELASEDIRLMEKYFGLPGIPEEILKVRREAFSSAHLHAAFTCEPDHLAAMKHYLKFITIYPPNLFKADVSPLAWWYLQPVVQWIRKFFRPGRSIR